MNERFLCFQNITEYFLKRLKPNALIKKNNDDFIYYQKSKDRIVSILSNRITDVDSYLDYFHKNLEIELLKEYIVISFEENDYRLPSFIHYGFEEIECEYGMGLKLRNLNNKLGRNFIMYEKLKYKEAISDFLEIIKSGRNSVAANHFKRNNYLLNENKVSIDYYLLKKGNRYISTFNLFSYNNTTSMWGVTTLPEYRNKRLTLQFIEQVLKEIKTKTDFCFLSAFNNVESFYEKLGFQEYFKIRVYSKKMKKKYQMTYL